YSGFYINNFEKLYDNLQRLKSSKKKVILLGVTYALIDFSNSYPLDLSNITIIETGGMKGRKKEMNKEELHSLLKSNFNLKNIGGEYGMTELLSQAYSKANGLYTCPPWMKIVITDLNDPFNQLENNQWGRINVIDLANIHSCSFIATDDIGRTNDKGQFEIAGRIDYSDMRGCSLLYT
ncbi:MAG: acyl transferase, partial [Bacteroidetes bacterium]|nr:acyl transferase [Bacteroidota bacterium]